VSGRIVVVEDEPYVQELLRDVLQAEGFSVVGLSHAQACRRAETVGEPDLILIDLMLPDMTGMQLAAELREIGHEHTPMVAISADRIALLFAARSGLFQDTVAKPFDLSTLLDSIQQYAGRYVTAV
jgi:two-component system, OmpR family, response regulator